MTLMFCRAGQDFYGSQLFGHSFIFEPLQYGFGNLFSTMNASSELGPALFSALVPDCSFR